MNINFRHISIDNFLSIGHVELNLENSGYTLVKGINNRPEDWALSNGSGKSTIFEAIIWCLCGETLRGSKNVTNIFGNDGAVVVLNFSFDGKEYKILRSKDNSIYKTTLKIEVDGKDISGKGIRDTEKILSETLPELNTSFIGSVIILGQGMPLKFSGYSPSGRKEVLEKLSKSDFMIEDLKKRLVNRKADLQNYQRSVEDELLVSETTVNNKQELCESTKKQLFEISSKDEYVSKLNELKLKLSSTLMEKEEYEKTFDLGEIDTRLKQLENEKSEYFKRYTDSKCVEQNNTLKAQEELRTTTLEIRTKISSLNKHINDVENMSDVCPTCHQKLPNVVKPDITKEITELEKLNKELDNINESIKSLETSCKIKCKALEDEYNKSILDLNNTLVGLKNKRDNINLKLKEFNNNISNLSLQINNIEKDISIIDNKISTLNETLNKCTEEINKLQNNIITLNSKKDDYVKRLSILSKFDTLIKRDFRGYLLCNVISYINCRVKEYAKDIFDNDLIEFSLDGNNILITYQGKDYENLSGGEKQKVDLIIQFSLRDMLSRYLGFSSSILVLDEIFDNLDSQGCEKVINMINNRFNDINSIYIISHHTEELNIPVDNVLTIVKGADGISELM